MIYRDFKGEKLSALGLGTMRMPVVDGKQDSIDEAKAREMVDFAMKNGINYYDTAWMYHGGNSERMIGKILADYPRGSFNLATKFPGNIRENIGRVEEIFEEQLKKCRVDHFDFYLFHNVCEINVDSYMDPQYGVMEYLLKQKKEGRIRHLGFSTHGRVDVMRRFMDAYGKDLEYTYDASSFDFEVPENNAGVEYLWRFSQAKMTFISDGDELVLAVHNSTAEDPALCLASAGKIGNRDESGYDIAWCLNLEPYTALLNLECLFIAKGTNSPAGARLFVRYITGGADGQSEGMKPFKKEGNWPVRDDVEDKKNPAKLSELGARANDLSAIYYIYPDVQDMWTYWLSKNPKMK